MTQNRPVTDYLARRETILSVEFFPPKDEEGGRQILETAQALCEAISPHFVSITYGAGGSTRERTFRYARILKDEFGFQVMPHLTCVGMSRKEVVELVKSYTEEGFCNIMALRGDPPKGQTEFKPHPDGPPYASDLVALLREHFSGLCLGVAGYPDVHPEAPSREKDLANLKVKVDAGASFITTQLFFDNEAFFNFQRDCLRLGIKTPVIPGIMPLRSASVARRFCPNIPAELDAMLEEAGDDTARVIDIGQEWAYRQCVELIKAGVPGIHLYIMNRSRGMIELVQRLKANYWV